MSGMGRAQRRVVNRRIAKPGELQARRAGSLVALQGGTSWWSMTPNEALRLAHELTDAAVDIIEEDRHG